MYFKVNIIMVIIMSGLSEFNLSLWSDLKTRLVILGKSIYKCTGDLNGSFGSLLFSFSQRTVHFEGEWVNWLLKHKELIQCDFFASKRIANKFAIRMLVTGDWVSLHLMSYQQLLQGSHRLEKYLNVEGFLEKSLEIKSALKSTGKSLKSLEKSLNSVFCRT